MPRGDVADLVAEHAGQFGLVVEKRQDAARDVDESARQCERVDRRLIDDGELPRKGGPLRELRETQANVADVLRELGIVIDAHLGSYLGIGFAAHRDLLRLAHQRELTLPGHGVGRAHAAITDAEQQESARTACR
jgi:hypothetical protein